MKRVLLATLLLLALPASGAASGGPAPGIVTGWDGVVAPGGAVRYVALSGGSTTTVAEIRVRGGRVLRSANVEGSFGVPLVTFNGVSGGLSQDGRTLVLAAWPTPSSTQFAVFNTHPLNLRDVITLPGNYSYDALAPNGSTLYLIEYSQGATTIRYRVRAYDLAHQRLLQQVIADKRLWGQYMRGTPVARATSRDGGWVYTLYSKPDGTGFVHALDAAHRAAVCVNLPWRRLADGLNYVRLAVSGAQLVLRQPGFGRLASIDTHSFAVRAYRRPVAAGAQFKQ